MNSNEFTFKEVTMSERNTNNMIYTRSFFEGLANKATRDKAESAVKPPASGRCVPLKTLCNGFRSC